MIDQERSEMEKDIIGMRKTCYKKGLGLIRIRKAHEKSECGRSVFAIQSIYIPPSMSILKKNTWDRGRSGFWAALPLSIPSI